MMTSTLTITNATKTAASVTSTTTSPPFLPPNHRHNTYLRHLLSLSKPFNSTIARPYRRFSALKLQVTSNNDSTRTTQVSTSGRSEVDKIVDGMDFGELCNEFECFSSPLVESTARQLVRDIIELRQNNRALGTYAASVKYKDPVRSFTGREKYKRPLWATTALEIPSVSVQEMVMLSTSVLSIKWTISGKPKSLLPGVIIGDNMIVKVDSKFTLNQISGQVIEHEESWDLSASPPLARVYFWASRSLFSTLQSGKDVVENVKDFTGRFSFPEEKNDSFYPDPSGDPTKFFQRDDGFQRDLYQVALFLALIYFTYQFLKETL